MYIQGINNSINIIQIAKYFRVQVTSKDSSYLEMKVLYRFFCEPISSMPVYDQHGTSKF